MFRGIVLIIIWLSVNMLLHSQELPVIDAALTTEVEDQIQTKPNRPVIIDDLINYGKRYLNVRYQFGASGPHRFDCSGFTKHVFSNFGIYLTRSSAEMARQVPQICVTTLQPGDLVFYQGRRLNGRVGHVGIVTEVMDNGTFRFIHAAVQQGVTITNSSSPYYTIRFLSAGRVPALMPLLTTNSEQYLHVDAEPQSDTIKVQEQVKIERVIPAVYHTVRKGENLSVIARKHRVSVAHIRQLNRLSNDMLQIRQRLLIQSARTVLE